MSASVASGNVCSVTGTPSDSGTFTVTYSVTDSVAATADRSASAGISAAASAPRSLGVRGFAVGRDGKIRVLLSDYVAGSIDESMTVVSLDLHSGSIDTAFGKAGHATAAGPWDYARPGGIALQHDGKILVAGGFYNKNTAPIITLLYPVGIAVCRFTAAGIIDTSFADSGCFSRASETGSYDTAEDLVVLDSGDILVLDRRFDTVSSPSYRNVVYKLAGEPSTTQCDATLFTSGERWGVRLPLATISGIYLTLDFLYREGLAFDLAGYGLIQNPSDFHCPPATLDLLLNVGVPFFAVGADRYWLDFIYTAGQSGLEFTLSNAGPK
jgi:hypothetical protein